MEYKHIITTVSEKNKDKIIELNKMDSEHPQIITRFNRHANGEWIFTIDGNEKNIKDYVSFLEINGIKF